MKAKVGVANLVVSTVCLKSLEFYLKPLKVTVFAVVNLLEKQSLSIYLDFWNAKYSYKAPTWYSMTSLF